ncbi:MULTISPECIES: hypothetical protein [Flavobacteriaceae]|uniref:hypothetical protein n=1 Tax=Flavobacteriaceae TaxID=49546 RepID=UPI003A92435D
MSIIGTNLMFVLIKVVNENNADEVKLCLSSSNFFSKKFNPTDFKKNELTLIGIENREKLISELNNYLNCYIDIEKLENGKLDFWSDQTQIGEFTVEKFEEKATNFDKSDWIESYEYLLNEYFKKEKISSKEIRLNNGFISKLEKLIEQERIKNEQKSEFFKTDSIKLNSIKEKSDLIDKFENIKNQYLSELRKI